MPVVNATISAIFDEIADLLDIQGANPFRVRAYRNAARTIGELGTDIKTLMEQGTALTDIPGIGEDLANKINEIVETGQCQFLERLHKEVPPAVIALLRIPGLGPKRVQTLWHDLKIQTLDQLLHAAKDGRIRDLPGFGEKTEQKIHRRGPGPPGRGAPLQAQRSGPVRRGAGRVPAQGAGRRSRWRSPAASGA